jgi:NitT/TauT family transport system ATP-binding protein
VVAIEYWRKVEAVSSVPVKEPIIEINDASMAYGGAEGVIALADANLKIGAGEFIAVVGPSGCGKSSLLKLVSGLHPPLRGSVRVGGQPVKGPLKICGMAFQNPMLLPWRTAIQNVLLPLEIVASHAGRRRWSRADGEARARELLATVGLAGFEDKYPWELSGGMQQRASLCRALIHAPQLLLLDEPFAALDLFTREELWGVLQTLWVQQRPTVILVTHDLREAIYLADTVYVISPRPGRVIFKADIDFPRPRTLSDTFTPQFTELSHTLRNQIGVNVQR